MQSVPHREQTHLNEVFSLKNISNFTNDDVILSPSKSIKMNMLNHHLNVTREQRSPCLAQEAAWACSQSWGLRQRVRASRYSNHRTPDFILFELLRAWVFAYMHICGARECLVPTQAGRQPQSPWNWSYRWVRPAMWVLDIQVLWKSSTLNL